MAYTLKTAFQWSFYVYWFHEVWKRNYAFEPAHVYFEVPLRVYCHGNGILCVFQSITVNSNNFDFPTVIFCILQLIVRL